MNLKKIFVYFAVPFGVTLALTAMYFSGVETLQRIVSPRIISMNPNAGREFGLLENLQNVILLVMVAAAFMGSCRKKAAVERWGFRLLGAFVVSVLLEEIDYGLHYYEYLKDISWKETRGTFNLHNEGNTTQITKAILDVGMAVWFVLLPLAALKVDHPVLRYAAPDRYSILTMVAMLVLRSIAHELGDRGFGMGGTINKNLSEFRELVIYYLFMLYVFEMAFRRVWPWANEEQPD